jgi:hypothetical protein
MLSSPRMSAIGASFGVGLQPGSTGTVDDQLARLMALEDLVSVAIAGDLIDADAAGNLATPGLRLLVIPQPGQLEPHVVDPRRPDPHPHEDQVAAPDADAEASVAIDETADEDAAVAAEDAAAAAEQLASLRQRRAAVVVGTLAIAVTVGVAGNLGWAGLALLVVAALFVAWVFA